MSDAEIERIAQAAADGAMIDLTGNEDAGEALTSYTGSVTPEQVRRDIIDYYESGKIPETAARYDDIKFSIKNIEGKNGDYGVGVYLDTNIFDNVKPRNWNKILTRYVYDNLAGKDVIAYDRNGKEEIISFAKKNERAQKSDATNSHRVIDKLARNRGNIQALSTVHIDELLQTAKYESSNSEHSHQWLDENGWEIRKTYVQDKKGKIYEATLNIANAKDGRRILYSISNIKEVDEGDVPSTRNGRGSLTNHRLLIEPTISQNRNGVKNNLFENYDNNTALKIRPSSPHMGRQTADTIARGTGATLTDFIVSRKNNDVNNIIRENSDNNTISTNAGLIRDEVSRRLSYQEMRALNQLAQLTGTSIRIAPTLGFANGMYQNGVITLALDADGKITTVFSHEITHHFAQSAPQAYADYQGAVMAVLAEESGQSEDALIQATIERYANRGIRLNAAGAREELAADYTRRILGDVSQIQKLIDSAKNLSEPRKRTLLQKLCDAIRAFIQQLRERVTSSLHPDIQKEISSAEKAAKALEQMAAEAVINKRENRISNRNTSEKAELDNSSYIHSDAFKRWFGDWESDPENASKVVNEDGTPKVVYHGTNAEFNVFDRSKGKPNDAGWLGRGYYFYGDYHESAQYAEYGKGRVMEVYLNIKNPYYAESAEMERLAELDSDAASEEFTQNLINEGYDGVYYNGDLREEWVAFYPTQIKSATDNIGTFDPNNADIRYSFGGENAKTADLNALARAKQMDMDGETPEKIWKDTGWGKGLDSKWRFEIDDSKMKFDKNGELKMSKAMRRANALNRKGTSITEEEFKELKEILKSSDEWERELKLGDYLRHTELNKAYPFLRHIKVSLQDLPNNELGSYDAESNEIILNSRKDSAILAQTLLHEVQHAIQKREGFARGSSSDYWELQSHDPQYQRTERRLQDEIFDVIQHDPENDKRYNELRNRLDNIGFELYRNTAGEIEARDSARRRNMTAEERRNTFPESMRPNENVVFAEDSGVSYSKNPTDDETISIKDQIRMHLDEINKLDPVSVLSYRLGQSTQQVRENVLKVFKNLGYKVERQNFGTIDIGEKQIREGLRYVNSDEERAALFTVPRVLKRGIIITDRNGHKNRGYDTVTIAAPVKINNDEGVVGVVVKKTKGYRYKTHRILMPDGSAFEFSDKNNRGYNGKMAFVSESESLPITSADDPTISQNDDDVKGDFDNDIKFSLSDEDDGLLPWQRDIEDIPDDLPWEEETSTTETDEVKPHRPIALDVRRIELDETGNENKPHRPIALDVRRINLDETENDNIDSLLSGGNDTDFLTQPIGKIKNEFELAKARAESRKGKVYTRADALKVAESIVGNIDTGTGAGVTMSKRDKGGVVQLVGYILNTKNAESKDRYIRRLSAFIAQRAVVYDMNVNADTYQKELSDLKAHITHNISLSGDAKEALDRVYGKSAAGFKAMLGGGATGVDAVYQELSWDMPGYFPENITTEDEMILRIVGVYNDLKDGTTENNTRLIDVITTHEDRRSMVDLIYAQLAEAAETSGRDSKLTSALEKQKEKLTEQQKKRLERQRERLRQQQREKLRQQKERLMERYEKKISDLKEKEREKARRSRERRQNIGISAPQPITNFGMKNNPDNGWTHAKVTISVDTKKAEKLLENVTDARKQFVDFAHKNFPKTVINQNTKAVIGISRTEIDKFLSGNITKEKYATGYMIPELIETAIKVGEEKNLKGKAGINGYEYYQNNITIDEWPYKAHIRVRNTDMGDKYYGHTISKDIEEIEIEPLARNSENNSGHPVNASDSNNSKLTQNTEKVKEKVRQNYENNKNKATEGKPAGALSCKTGYHTSDSDNTVSQKECNVKRNLDKNKSQQWATSRGLQLPKLVQSISDNNSILQKENIVNNSEENYNNNVRFSLKSDDAEFYDDIFGK